VSGAVSEDIRQEFKERAVREGIEFAEVDRNQSLFEVATNLICSLSLTQFESFLVVLGANCPTRHYHVVF
jgi:hypothetical protein